MIALRMLYYGWVVLAIAIVLNAGAVQLSLTTWYVWTQAISERGLPAAFADLSGQDRLFLFLLYPAALGLVVYGLSGAWGSRP